MATAGAVRERGIQKAGRTPGDSPALQPFRKASLLPFEQLPNLPKPRIPVIHLDTGSTLAVSSIDMKAIR